MQADKTEKLRAGAIGGLLGGVIIWVYEAVVWVGVQHLLPLAGIPRNATGLVFGRTTQEALGAMAYVVGTSIHFAFASLWGILFALVWPALQRRGWEASLAGLLLAPPLWIVMHVAIAVVGDDHPDYLDPVIIIGGFMSHIFFTVPMTLYVKRALSPR